jgi:Uma2 family endonuclease
VGDDDAAAGSDAIESVGDRGLGGGVDIGGGFVEEEHGRCGEDSRRIASWRMSGTRRTGRSSREAVIVGSVRWGGRAQATRQAYAGVVSTTTSTGVSVEEFLDGDYPDGAWLVEGEVVVNDPTFRHQDITLRICSALLDWTRRREGSGQVGFGGNWTIAPGTTYKPDAWWVDEAQAALLTGARSDAPPALAVEVRSPGTWALDIGIKRARYEQAGVTELWLVDTPAEVVLVHRRSSPQVATFDVVREVARDETLTTPLLDGFTLDLDDLFA